MNTTARFAIITAGMCLGLSGGADAAQGRAHLAPTSEESALSGDVTFEDTPGGLSVSARISGAPSGHHGFHIHEFGGCEDAGNAAGGHYNPAQVKHGDLSAEGLTAAHAGDLGNVEIGESGEGAYQRVLPGITLADGTYTVGGRAVILHTNPDDFGQPTGNAGGRIGCGIILITKP